MKLKEQCSCKIILDVGIYKLYIKVISGTLKINHGCYTPDGQTWSSLLMIIVLPIIDYLKGKNINYDLILKLAIENDIINIVNLHFLEISFLNIQSIK